MGGWAGFEWQRGRAFRLGGWLEKLEVIYWHGGMVSLGYPRCNLKFVP